MITWDCFVWFAIPALVFEAAGAAFSWKERRMPAS